MQNPILEIIKIALFLMLALLVGLSFWQETKQEDRTEVLGKRISDVEQSLDRLSTSITKLDRRIQQGVSVSGVGAGTAASGSGDAQTAPPAAQMEAHAWKQEPAPWLRGRAKELWGTYGENYLKPDPNWPKSASLDDPVVDPTGSITLWYGSAPPNLNPLTLSDGGVTNYVRTYCDEYWGVPHSQDPYLYKPELAWRVEVSPDYKTWIFWIRPGVRWQTPQVDLEKYPHLKGDHFLTAQDWKFTMDLAMNKDVRAAHIRAYFQDFERCEVVDDHCFIMHWKKSSFSSIASNMNMISPLPRFIFSVDESGKAFDPATIGSQFNEHWFGKGFLWVGTGPYYVQRYDPDKEVVLQRFNDYWGDLPAIQTIRREMFPNEDLAKTKFEAGEFTSASYRAPQWKKRIAGRPELNEGRWGEHWTWSTSYGFIAYKNTHPIFRDVQVRHAMTHAANRQRMLEAVSEGRGRIVTGPQSMHAPTYPQDLKPLPFDLDKARALLAEAGWADQDGNGVLEKNIDGTRTEFRVKAMIPESAFFRTVFEIFREDLAKIGVRLELEPLQWSQFTKRLDDRTFDITSLFWSTDGWDNDMTQIWHSKMIEEPESSNFIEFSDPEVDRLIEKARATFDKDERVSVQSAAHRRIAELQPYTFLFSMQLVYVYWKDKISDYSLGDRWRTRPFVRLFPMYVPRGEPK